jgi:phage terminase large subunit
VKVQIKLPEKLVDVFTGDAMYRGAYGGRGSAKTRSFCKMTAVKGLDFAQQGKTGVIVCGREFQNSLAESSLAEVKAAIAEEPFLRDRYEVGDNYVRTKDKRIEYAFIGLRHNLDSVKSKSRIRLLYVDEAEPVSDIAWMKVIPTIREEGSEIWMTWNPERKNSATHLRFREDPPTDSKIIQLNWRDNPWFPDILNKTRLDDLAKRPDQYDHVWEGDFITAMSGAYFAKHLATARLEHRIGHVAADPLMKFRVFCDIGGTGARADAFAMWVNQFIGREVRSLNYYEAIGQPLAVHVAWLMENGYTPVNTVIYLPHDGTTHDKVFDVTYESELRKAGYEVVTITNQGTGAATKRIEAVRRILPSCWFNEVTTSGGIDALGWYHEKRDENRGIGLGPEHDWSSHGADAFGLMAIVAEDIFDEQNRRKAKPVRIGSGGWMG